MKLYTPKEISKLFNIGINQAYALMHSSGFPTITLNRKMYVEESSLEKWIKTNEGRKYIY